jgi:general nucleoside transport system ATP-binding protein
VTDTKPPFLEMRGITKAFGGILANDHIDFDVRPGEVHALLGENGAGKTTLMEVLYGLYTPDAGEIYVEGKHVQIHSPLDAIRLGIDMVHQSFMLIPVFSVCENMVLGMPGRHDLRQTAEEVRELSQGFGLEVDPLARTGDLPVGMQQRVEIVRALYRGARLLVLDEPTAVLTPIESANLMRFVRSMASEGRSVIIITHKLEEALEASDRVAVLRRGRKVATRLTRETNARELSRLMVGRELEPATRRRHDQGRSSGLAVEHLSVRGEEGTLVCKDVSFGVHCGEILGVAGVSGNGQSALAEAITGLRPPAEGRVSLLDVDVTGWGPRALMRAGMAHVPEDRKATGCVGAFNLVENLILGRHREPSFAQRGLILRRRAMREFAERTVQKFDIRAASLDTATQVLSGGNVQKLILARELQRNPTLLVAVEPTRGLDVGAIEYAHRTIVGLCDDGVAVLLFSSDLSEVFALSDLVAVMYHGRLLGPFPIAEVDIERIGYMMTRGIAA